MAAEGKVKGMKWVLIIAGLITLIYWGVMLVFVTPGMAALYGVPYPQEPIYVRVIGMLCVLLGLLFLLASRDPVKNRLVVDIGIINYALFLIFGIMSKFIAREEVGFFGFFWWNILVLWIFLILFIRNRPKAAKT